MFMGNEAVRTTAAVNKEVKRYVASVSKYADGLDEYLEMRVKFEKLSQQYHDLVDELVNHSSSQVWWGIWIFVGESLMLGVALVIYSRRRTRYSRRIIGLPK
eukprot:TRINITY_DN2355_c0_g1_i1.p1 TRINITY_DN2355_c0_g1~~TRINITY_DN2355_c0_g1_i1.p1  ORF type:complete len:102 (-),score=12.33 TRINITY_DN2355_c0_g1_i1:13-318(-)